MAADSDVPERVGPYEVVGVLGQGGMGCVFKARHPRLDRIVAVKQLLTGFDDEQRMRFAREAAVLRELDHPGVVRLLDYDVETETPYIVFEFIEGRSLVYTIGGRPVAAAKALDISIQIADALAALHARGLIHRDLKPANVMVRQGGDEVVLIDLGIAKHVGDFQRTMDHLTQAGVFLGTPGYYPPEGGLEPDSSAGDCFALGVILYEMLTNVRPFVEAERLGFVAYMDAVRQGGFEPASAVEPSIPTAIDGVIAKLLEVDPRQRIQDGAGAAAALTDVGARVFVGADRERVQARAATRELRRPSAARSIATGGVVANAAGHTKPGPVRRPSSRVSLGSGTQRSSVAAASPGLSSRDRVGIIAGLLVFGCLALLVRSALNPQEPPSPSAQSTPSAASPPPEDAGREAKSIIRALERCGSILHSRSQAIFKSVETARSAARRTPAPGSRASFGDDLAMLCGGEVHRHVTTALGLISKPALENDVGERVAGSLLGLELVEQYCDLRSVASPFSVRLSESLRSTYGQPAPPMDTRGMRHLYLKPEFFPLSSCAKEGEPQTIQFALTEQPASKAAIFVLGNRLFPEFLVSLSLNGHWFSLRSHKAAPFGPESPGEQRDRRQMLERVRIDSGSLWPNFQKDIERSEAVGMLGHWIPAYFLRARSNTLVVRVLEPAGPRHVVGPTIWQVIVGTRRPPSGAAQ